MIGRLEGQVTSKDDLEYHDSNHRKENGHILNDEIITALDPMQYELSGCYIGDSQYSLIRIDPLLLNSESDVGLDNINEIISDAEPFRMIEWFFTGRVKLVRLRGTKRMRTDRLSKICDIDLVKDDPMVIPQSTSRDYFLINTGTIKCIVQITPEAVLPEWSHGISIEYLKDYGIPDEETRIAIAEVVGLVLGTRLLKIGSTELDKNNEILRRSANNPYGDNIKTRCSRVSLAPVKLSSKYGLRVEAVINEILPNYLRLKDSFSLSAILWRYWTAKDLAIGTNLPILSSALESLGDEYLKYHGLQTNFSESEKEEYSNLIKEEIKSLEDKLSKFSLKDSVLNRLRHPFNMV